MSFIEKLGCWLCARSLLGRSMRGLREEQSPAVTEAGTESAAASESVEATQASTALESRAGPWQMK